MADVKTPKRRTSASIAGACKARHSLLAALAIIPALALAAPAQAAGPPTAITGVAKEVSFGSATLTGSVDPKAANTSYYFQYGLTRAYGEQTAIADAGAGTSTVKVSLPVSGLQPLTLYYYRLVAVNSRAATLGANRSFLTTKVPLSLAILASPNPVAYGGTVTVQGTLSGTENADREVILQANVFPYTGGFQPLGNPELTNASGSFTFSVPGASVGTQYRVITTTNPAVVSALATEEVAVQVASHIARGRKGAGHARIYGTVTPAENGAEVGILRIERGRGVLVGGTRLKAATATTSTFSREVPVGKGVYRVLIRVVGAAQISNYGAPLLIR